MSLSPPFEALVILCVQMPCSGYTAQGPLLENGQRIKWPDNAFGFKICSNQQLRRWRMPFSAALFSEVFFCMGIKSLSHEPNQQARRRIGMILIKTKYWNEERWPRLSELELYWCTCWLVVFNSESEFWLNLLQNIKKYTHALFDGEWSGWSCLWFLLHSFRGGQWVLLFFMGNLAIKYV